MLALFTALATLQAGAWGEIVRGDVDANGVCNIGDLTTLINHLVYNTTPPAMWLADIDGNGTLGMDDLTALINYLVFNDATGINMSNADADTDGTVGMDDLTALINYLVFKQWP